MSREISLEQQMTELLRQLQLFVKGPTFSLRLDEIRAIAADGTIRT